MNSKHTQIDTLTSLKFTERLLSADAFTYNLFCFLNLSTTVKTTYYYSKLNDKKSFILQVCESLSVLQISSFVSCFYILHRSDITWYLSFSDLIHFISVQSLSHVWLFTTPWTAAQQASLSNTNSQSLLKLMSIKLVMSSNHLILCYSLLLLPSIFPSIRVFSNESVLHIRWPKYWSFSFSISHFNEYSGLISFRIDWLDLLALQGTLKSLLQHHSAKHQFFGAQFSL